MSRSWRVSAWNSLVSTSLFSVSASDLVSVSFVPSAPDPASAPASADEKYRNDDGKRGGEKMGMDRPRDNASDRNEEEEKDAAAAPAAAGVALRGVLAVIIPAHVIVLMLLSLLLSLAFLRNNVDADARERPRAGRSRRTRPEVTTTIACFCLSAAGCWLQAVAAAGEMNMVA